MTKNYSNLMKEIQKGKFVFTGELEPARTTDISSVLKEAKELKGYVQACNVTDNPGSNATMSSLVASHLVQTNTGMEVVYQLRCSDRNRIALTSDLLGAAALGIRNVLALTGDHTLLGDMPNAKPVFDLDSNVLVKMIRQMVDEGKDLNGNEILGPKPKFSIGIAANPNANPIEPEIMKIVRKIESGAHFIQTQVCFNIDKTLEFLRMFKSFNIPILVGIFPMKSYGTAKFFNAYVPGVAVPKDLMKQFVDVKKEGYSKSEKREKYNQINLEFFVPFIKEIMKSKLCEGCHIMSVHYTSIIPKILQEVQPSHEKTISVVNE
jgi:5,10-methylenetetrahydrofolate reductase